MEELFIKTEETWDKADLSASSSITLAYKSNLLGTIGDIESSYSYTVSLPKTQRNKALFRMAHLPACNSSSVIGHTFEARYYKDGVNILGDAVAYLDSVKEETFEISISFGFLAALNDWLTEDPDLNDLESDLTVTYDNETTRYPDSLADLPDVFKPTYDIGITFDADDIARCPAVRVPYVLSLIEKRTDCIFRFPDAVEESFQSLAVLLTNKIKTDTLSLAGIKLNGDVSLAWVSNGSTTATYSDMVIFQHAIFAPSSEADGLLSVDEITLPWRGARLGTYGNDSFYFDYKDSDEPAEINVLTPQVDLTVTLQTALDYRFDSGDKESGAGDFSTSETFYWWVFEIGGLDRDDPDDITVERYASTGAQYIYSGIESTQPYIRLRLTDIGTLALRKGYSYFFCLVSDNDSTTATFNGTFTLPDASQHFSVVLPQKTTSSLDCTIREASAAGISLDLPVVGNLPDMTQMDFVQALCDMFAVFPVVNPVPETDTASGRRIVDFVSIDTLYENKKAREIGGTVMNDWTDRLVTDIEAAEITFSKTGYAHRNWMRYDDNDTVYGDYDGYFDIDDDNLAAEDDLVNLPFAATDNSKIPLFTKETDDDGNTTYEAKDVGARILRVVNYGGKCQLAFGNLAFPSLIATWYSDYIALVQDTYITTLTLRLSVVDLKYLDFTVPVYLHQFGRWFGVVEIEANGDDENCEVQLMRLPINEEA